MGKRHLAGPAGAREERETGMDGAAINIPLTWIDGAIIILYLLAMIAIGFFFKKNRAASKTIFWLRKG